MDFFWIGLIPQLYAILFWVEQLYDFHDLKLTSIVNILESFIC